MITVNIVNNHRSKREPCIIIAFIRPLFSKLFGKKFRVTAYSSPSPTASVHHILGQNDSGTNKIKAIESLKEPKSVGNRTPCRLHALSMGEKKCTIARENTKIVRFLKIHHFLVESIYVKVHDITLPLNSKLPYIPCLINSFRLKLVIVNHNPQSSSFPKFLSAVLTYVLMIHSYRRNVIVTTKTLDNCN